MGWVRSMGRAALINLWERVRDAGDVGSWPPGKAFEYLILRAFELEGARVVWPYRGWLEQVDGAVYVDGLSCLIECKHWKESLDFTPIARFKARVDRRPPATVGLLFSVSGFTMPALQEAHVQPVRVSAAESAGARAGPGRAASSSRTSRGPP